MSLDEEEQPMLIDVTHPLAKPLKRAATAYKKAMKERMDALAREIDLKGKLIAAAKGVGAKPNADGVVSFRMAELTIKITPRDELVKVKFEEDSDENDGPDEETKAEGAEQV